MEHSEEKAEKEEDLSRDKNSPRWAQLISVALIVVGFLMLSKIYTPLIMEEIRYQFSKEKEKVVISDSGKQVETKNNKETEVIVPVDLDFSLVVPKISANSKVVSDVNPDDSSEYQRALTKGVAHASGTAHPGEDGNVFIFAHSGVDFTEALRYNAIFYLLNKMEKGDDMVIFYKGEEFRYEVQDKKIVDAEEMQYMKGDEQNKTLTLMTCWPAGTTFKRLVVIGQQK